MTVDPGTGAGWEPASGVPTAPFEAPPADRGLPGAPTAPAVPGAAPEALTSSQVSPASPGEDPSPDEDPSPATADPSSRVEEIEHLLDAVESALDRLDDGTYGTCATCGQPIDDARLRADATALECAVCDARTTV